LAVTLVRQERSSSRLAIFTCEGAIPILERCEWIKLMLARLKSELIFNRPRCRLVAVDDVAGRVLVRPSRPKAVFMEHAKDDVGANKIMRP
jgi:hypothetical protein